MNTSELTRDVREYVNATIANGQRVNRAWLVHAFIKDRGALPDGDYDKDFYRIAGFYAVEAISRKVIAKASDVEPNDSSAPPLPGYEHLRSAYPVRSADGDIEIVPTHMISDDDLLDRASEFDVQAKGLRKHAKEMREYVANRQNVSVA